MDYLVTDTELTDVADAIRQKGGTSGTLEWPTGFEQAIANIPSGGGGDDGSFKAVIERTATNPTLPSDLTSIGNFAFHTYSTLALTSLPSSITSIESYAFYRCRQLALTSLPSGLTSIGGNAFESCDNLALTSLPSGLTQIEPSVFKSCVNIALTSLPSSITNIGSYAFNGCTSITSISCEGLITNLSSNSFTGSGMNLASVRFPRMEVNSLGQAFGNSSASTACQKLEFADIGKTKAIAASAFANCYKLQTLVLRRSGSICTLANYNAFLNTPMRGYNGLTGTIYVPQALIETYKTATNWSTIYNEGHLTFAPIEGSEYEL